MYKIISTIWAVGGIFIISASHAANAACIHISMKPQDSLWKKYENEVALDGRLYDKRSQLTLEEYLILHENYLRKMRKQGLEIWNALPNDKNRYVWLKFTVAQYVPSYYDFAHCRFDTVEKANWDKLYPALKKEYLNYIDKEIPEEQRPAYKFFFERDELAGDIIYHKLISQVTGKKFDIFKYVDPSIKLIKKASSKSLVHDALQNTLQQILNRPDDYGINDKDISSFLTALKVADIPDLNEWVDGKNRMLKLKQEPLQLSFQSVDGRTIDVGQMKGKVVLIDFWATWCGACLEYMPTVKELYKKYHEQGLEVVSISINKKAEKEQVLIIEKKLNVSWPLAIIGDEKLKKDIWKKFAFTSIPQLILLNKNGILIEDQGKLLNKETLNELVKNALK